MSALSITKLYSVLATKWGNETAETVSNFVDQKIAGQMENKFQTLATKEDIHRLELKIEQEIGGARSDLGKDNGDLRSDFTKEIASVRTDLGKAIADLGSELRKEIACVRTDLGKDIADLGSELRKEINQVKFDLIKWMVTLWIAQAVLFLTLLLRK